MYTEVVDQSISYTQDKSQKLKKACDDFEALFLSQMFSTMRETVPQDGLLEKNQGEQIFTQMLDSQVAQDFTKNRSVGLSDMLYKSMSKYVDGADAAQDKTAGVKNSAADQKTLEKNNKENANGNNFPKQEKTTASTEDFLKLRRQLNGTNVASDMLIR